jgi:hypothetical protein
MLLFKSKLILVALFLPLSLMASEACLTSQYDTVVSHKGQPFGLTETKLSISKKGCVIDIGHEKLRFIKKNWLVDVCRSPVHIKTGAGAVTVLRRVMDCQLEEASLDPFCMEVESMKRMMEDDGLIFAEGDKDNLADPHGKVTCAVNLIQQYLHHGRVLSVGDFSTRPQKQNRFSMPDTSRVYEIEREPEFELEEEIIE